MIDDDDLVYKPEMLLAVQKLILAGGMSPTCQHRKGKAWRRRHARLKLRKETR